MHMNSYHMTVRPTTISQETRSSAVAERPRVKILLNCSRYIGLVLQRNWQQPIRGIYSGFRDCGCLGDEFVWQFLLSMSKITWFPISISTSLRHTISVFGNWTITLLTMITIYLMWKPHSVLNKRVHWFGHVQRVKANRRVAGAASDLKLLRIFIWNHWSEESTLSSHHSEIYWTRERCRRRNCLKSTDRERKKCW